jgi:hypothetical protein
MNKFTIGIRQHCQISRYSTASLPDKTNVEQASVIPPLLSILLIRAGHLAKFINGKIR